THLTSRDPNNSPTHPIIPTVFASYALFNDHDSMETGENQKSKDLRRTPVPHQSIFSYSRPLGTPTENGYEQVIPNPHTDQPTMHPIHTKPESLSALNEQVPPQGFSDQPTESRKEQSSPSAVVHHVKLTQTSGFTLNNVNSITSSTPVEIQQYWSQPAEQLTATKASQANNTELVEMLNKTTSKAPMRTTDNKA
ncbi:hemicentin-2-like isoform X1, partial [Clarias magur]